MKSIRLYLSALTLLVAGFAWSPGASAQSKVNCAPSTPCVNGTGPYNTGTGTVAADAFGIINANFSLLPSQLFAGTALPVNKGGTGALTLTGLLKGNGASAFTVAASSDVIPLWSGTCSASTFLRGDGSCQTPAGGSSAWNSLTSGTNTSMAAVLGTGSSLTTSGTGVNSANQINGTALSGLATGLLKNTTATGVPSIATSADVIADWSGTCSTTTFLRGDGSCQTPSGGGNLSNSGTPTVHQTSVWQSSTTISGVGPGTTGQAFASTGASTDPAYTSSLSGVTSVNGSTVPSSTTLSGLGTTETFTAPHTFTNSDLLLLGSSTGVTTFTSANAGASNFTVTVPAATDTVALLAATQTLTNKSIAASEVNSGTFAAAQMPALTGDATSTSGTVATTVGKINGTSLAGLATGILKNTTTTGVPSIATSADVIADFTGTCSSTTFLRGDGACQTPAGSGTVTTSGTPASGNLTKFSGATAVTNGDLSGDVTTSGTLATTVVKVNGGAVPASAAVLASNGSSQLTALTLGGNLAVVSGVLQGSQTINAQTGTTYPLATTDAGKLVTFSNASAVAVSLSVATTAGFTAGYSFDVQNKGAGTVTITPTTSTINGAATLVIPANNGCTVTSDGANYQVSSCTAVDTTTFTQVTGGTSTGALLVGTGGSLAASGTGTISANQVNGATVPASAGMVSTNSSNQIVAQAVVTDAAPGAGPTNDYSPTGFGPTTGVLYITPTSGGTTFNGMVAQSTLQHVYIVNAEAAGGADLIKLVNQSASDTTAANRFLTSATSSLAIPPGGRVLCVYLPSTVSRWQCQ